MQPNPHLSIVIPTYNRADFLDFSLGVHIPLARAYNVQLFISDNASTDNTEQIVNKRMNEYPLIRYYKNEINVGPDENFERALKYPQSKYVWLLGDTYRIPPEGISYIIELVTTNTKYAVMVFNFAKRVYGIPRQNYTDQNKLLLDLGWHMTCMASSVYNSELIADANFKRYKKTNFLQTGIIFEYLAQKEFVVHWIETLSLQEIRIEGIKKNGWLDQTIEIWAKDWANLIFSLPPSYDLNIKLSCIKEHGIKSGIFTLQPLLILRSMGLLNYKIYKQYCRLFPLSIKYSKFTLLVISFLPRAIPRVLQVVKRAIKH